uniref:C2H2-type domain-containing protein n=1 Tax=Romanomermis culicivorax TaxID=13658 RepID=A0A915I838_ROMCU
MNRRQPAVYTCKVCKYSCAQKFHFNSHMNTHTDRKCTMCDYTSRTEGRLKKHMNEAHLPLPSDSGRRSIAEDDVSEVFDPIGKSHQYSPPSPDGYLCDSEMADDSRCGSFLLANSNDMLQSSSVNHHPSSKPKRYKCKQCHYIAPSKDNFWEHQRSHIKPERLMSCSHCLFVTEYKHHMEYHLRNHSNVKPHKCPKCNYCCVNKSMLNSHLKSHSSVYQYRCRDCSYETKYCHSLKQHLRKHNHRPGKLVNQDGVEQEIQLDVYGNRRGPKVRRNNNNNDSNVHSEKTNCGSDKDSIFDQPPTVVVTRVSSKPTSARNSPNSAQQLISPLSLLDASNAASILASKSSSNIYQNLLLNRNGICSTTLTNGLASVPFLGSGGSMGVQLPTVPDLLTTAAATTTSSSSSSCVQTHNNSDVEKFKQMLAAQYLFLLKQQAMAAAAAAAAAAIDSSRSTPNVAAATTGDNTFLLNGGDAGLIFSSTGYALGGIGSFGFNKEQQDQEQRGRSRSFIGTLATSKSNYIKTNIGTEKKSSVINNGITPSTLMSSQLRLPRENTKFPSINADISSVTVSVADPLSVGTTSPRCRSRSPVCEALKASCSSDDGSGSNASNSHTNGGANFSLGNGSSRRKGKAFKLVDSIAMRLQSGNNSSSPVEDAESVNVNEVENIQENGSPSVAEYSDENICGNLNLEMRSADICSTDHQNDQQPKCDNHNNNDASILSHSHSSIIQQHNNQSSLATTTSSDAHMIVDGQQRDQSSVIDFSRSYHCSHCGIWFKCQIMYLLHKGCHSSDNPFKCNLCGATCDDSLKFFLHITQAPHDEL